MYELIRGSFVINMSFNIKTAKMVENDQFILFFFQVIPRIYNFAFLEMRLNDFCKIYK